jgi:UDP-glucose 4-epimerase
VRVLVTGGAGFLGAPVAAALLADGHEVRVLDDLSTGRSDRVPAGAALLVGDVADAGTTVAAAAGADAVVHLAAARAVPRSIVDPLATDRANTGGTLAVLEAARQTGIRRVVLASSSSVYGDAEELPTPETAPLRPRSPYAVSKLAGEHYARVFTEVHGLDTVALRYFNLYGPDARVDVPFALAVPTLVADLREGRAPELHGGGVQRRDLTFVDDAVAATVAALSAPAERVAGRAFNVGTGCSTSIAQVLGLLQELFGTTLPAVTTPARPGDVAVTCADPTLAATALGFRARVGLTEGLRRVVAAVPAVA